MARTIVWMKAFCQQGPPLLITLSVNSTEVSYELGISKASGSQIMGDGPNAADSRMN
jgi:hypothetical protein